MGSLGDWYGSERHLLRYLTDPERKAEFDEVVLRAVGSESVTWLVDGPFFRADGREYGARRPDDRLTECRGLDFLEPAEPTRQAWTQVWPTRGNTLKWDAVGQAQIGGQSEWLLVEANAHLGEVESSCRASQKGGLGKISVALERTQDELGISPRRDWLHDHYQFCNRIVALNHLLSYGVPARLVFVYFCGDAHFADAPKTEDGWLPALRLRGEHVGRPFLARIEDRLRQVFADATS